MPFPPTLRLLILLAVSTLALASGAAFAQPAPGTCAQGTASADLALSDVQARLFNTGSLFYSPSSSAIYLVPKFSNRSPIYAAGLWIGGSVGGELRVAGSRYDNFEFWPGPLADDGRPVNPDDCAAYDRIWRVSVEDLALYDETGVPPADLADWPVNLGAPVTDGDGVEGNYNLKGGDRPEIYGHETAFWVMNDVGNAHLETGSDPIGVEVRATAFSVVSKSEALSQATFYRYEVAYVGEGPGSAALEDAHLSLWADPDLGGATDDYVGVDTTRNLAFTYNGDDDDSQYGVAPPAVGFQFFERPGAHVYFIGGALSDPGTAEEYYNIMQGQWKTGVPVTESGWGYDTPGPVTTFAFAGDPVTGRCWSEVNPAAPQPDGSCEPGDAEPLHADDRRQVISTEAFSLEAGETKVFDFAILFGRGDDHLDSITELRFASDVVRARYDAGTLYAPGNPLPPSVVLSRPEALTPSDGRTIASDSEDLSVDFAWSAVPAAEGYRLEVDTSAAFTDPIVVLTDETTRTLSAWSFPVNRVLRYHWRVRAERGINRSPFSEPRSFTFFRYKSGFIDEGDGIVEVANPDVAPCPDEGDPGCASYGGNTVWQDANVTGNYYLTAAGVGPTLGKISRFTRAIGDDDLEIRFTEACATPGACLAVRQFTDNVVVSVPFEMWNVGDPADEGDDLRLIPIIDSRDPRDTDWADNFTGVDEWRGSPCLEEDGTGCPITDDISAAMPDRPDGYARFAEAANGFGGVGAIYDPEIDGDDQEDPDPSVPGGACELQGYYSNFCYNNDRLSRGGIVVPILRLVFADLAGDGTTPAAGTTIRLITADRLLVDAEPGAADVPSAGGLRLDGPWPNPARSHARIAYDLGERPGSRLGSERVEVKVYDVLGRAVAVLPARQAVSGRQEAVLKLGALASGVYLVVVEAGSERVSRRLTVVR